MYGFVNRAIELMVQRKFGQEVWEEVKREAGIELPSHFLVRVTYPDSITYALVGAAEKVLKVPAAAILELFGAFFYEFCVESGYDRILQVLGSTTADFLNNLDALHDHLATIYPGMRAPSFRCTNVGNGIILHYYSERPGLEPIVVGLVKTVAKELHGSTVKVTVSRAKASDGSNQDHVQFLIQEENQAIESDGTAVRVVDGSATISGNERPPALGCPINAARGTNAVLNTTNAMDAAIHDSLTSRLSNSTTTTTADGGKLRRLQHEEEVQQHIISPDTFAMLFPFHIMFDRNLQVIQAGASVCRFLPQLTSPHCYIDAVFDLVRPRLDFTFDSLLSHINTITILETKAGLLGYAIHVDGHARHLRLKGQMIQLAEHDAIVFVASPSVTSLDDMVAHSIKLSDVPVHDATRDLVLMSEHWSHEYKLAQNLEYFIDMLQHTYKALDEEKHKTDNLLYSVLPPSVATRLKQNQPVPAQRYFAVTLLFTGIVGFNEYCRMHGGSRGAMIIVKMLNMVFSAIDAVVDLSKGKVYKVETVQDHYVAVSGLPEPCDDHAKAVAELALNLMDSTADFFDDEGNPIKITIGVHSGEIVSGVIGNKAPRYCLFGNAVNIASRTLTCGIPERINVSETTYEFQLDYRGEVEMKGKPAPMKCYLLARAPIVSPTPPPPTPPAVVEPAAVVANDVKTLPLRTQQQKPPPSPRKLATAQRPEALSQQPPKPPPPPLQLEIASHPALEERTPMVVYHHHVTPTDTDEALIIDSPVSPSDSPSHPAATTVHRSTRIADQIAAVDFVRAQRAQKAVPIIIATTAHPPATSYIAHPSGNNTNVQTTTSPFTVTASSRPVAPLPSSHMIELKRPPGRFAYTSSTTSNNNAHTTNTVQTVNNYARRDTPPVNAAVERQQSNTVAPAKYMNGPISYAASSSLKQLPTVARSNPTTTAATPLQPAAPLARHQYFSPEVHHRRPKATHSHAAASSSRPVRFHTHDNNYYLPQDERAYATRELANDAASARRQLATMHRATSSTAVPPPRDSPRLNNISNRSYKSNNMAATASPATLPRLVDGVQSAGNNKQYDYYGNNNRNNNNNGTAGGSSNSDGDGDDEEQQVYVRVKPSSSITTPLHVTRAVQVVSYTPTFVNTALVQADTEQVQPETKGRPRWRLYKVTRV